MDCTKTPKLKIAFFSISFTQKNDSKSILDV